MNGPVSPWAVDMPSAANSGRLPLATRYRSADPIDWQGSKVYPMYTEQLSSSSSALTLSLLSAAPPSGVRAVGMGLSMVDGFIGLDSKRLTGVDVWREALEAGITFELSATVRGALFSLTPVWRDDDGEPRSWSGNYGIVVEQARDGRTVLHCSMGEGPPDFADLVVEVRATPTDAPTMPQPELSAHITPTISVPLTASASGTSPDADATAETSPPPWSLAAISKATSAAPRSPAFPVGGHSRASARRARLAAPAQVPDTSPASGAQVDCTTIPPHLVVAADMNVSTIGDTAPLGTVDAAPRRDHGYRGALYDLGVAMYSRGEEQQAYGLWMQAAAAGHAEAAYELGVVYFRRGDLAEAERWWRTAAHRRVIRAMAGLAELLDRRGDHTQARLWRTQAATEHAVAAMDREAAEHTADLDPTR